MAGPSGLIDLVGRFEQNRDAYLSGAYNETQVRREFIDPFFELLGWDIANKQGLPEAYKDVVHEDAVRIGGGLKAPDYGFRVGGTRRFFVEAKRPSVNVRDKALPAFQLRRYAWSAKLPLSILTDFEEFAVYDCRITPNQVDRPSTARLNFFSYFEYPDRWDEIAALFSRDAVLAGSLDAYADAATTKRGSATVDAVFLKEIESWRDALAKDLALRNPDLTSRQLNFAVQMTIDRIIFLRMAEDRGIEEYGRLQALLNGRHVYDRLRELYRQADERYNSGLFHFQQEKDRPEQPDQLTPKLIIGDEPLKNIVKNLYFPDSPYEFSVLPVEVLGQVYEQFLGKTIDLTPGRGVKIEEKPEVRKAGGVYYTPKYIVDYIVEHTAGKLLEGKTPGKSGTASKLRIVDPACGSGSFLIGAYEFLLDWHRDRYLELGPEKHRKEIYQGAGGQWLLTTAEKKRILLNNIYGVDIDPQAVEVTKLSLLLKVLEGESAQTIGTQLTMFHERALPDLSNNINCGNSLVGTDFYDGLQLTLLEESVHFRVNVADWNALFPTVMTAGGFDAVIGNPPWLMAGYYLDDTLDYLRSRYATATGKFDLYYLFLEKGVKLLKSQGALGMIVPNKLFHTRAARELRTMLFRDNWIAEIVDFADRQVFANATNYSCILFLRQGEQNQLPPIYREVTTKLELVRSFDIPNVTLEQATWNFADQSEREIFAKMEQAGVALSELVFRFGTGVQSGADKILMIDSQRVEASGIELEIIRPVLRGRDVRRYGSAGSPSSLVFPYKVVSDQFVPLDERELEQFKVGYALLTSNKDRLGERRWFGKTAEELSGVWYGMVYLDSFRSFQLPHLLTPSLSDRTNFTLGTSDLFATGTAGVTSVIPEDTSDENLLYLLGVLNSKLINFYAIRHSPVFSGKFYKFSAPYLSSIPIPSTSDFDSCRSMIASLAQSMIELQAKLDSATDSHTARIVRAQIASTDRQIDQLVYQLYGLTEDEIALVEQSA